MRVPVFPQSPKSLLNSACQGRSRQSDCILLGPLKCLFHSSYWVLCALNLASMYLRFFSQTTSLASLRLGCCEANLIYCSILGWLFPIISINNNFKIQLILIKQYQIQKMQFGGDETRVLRQYIQMMQQKRYFWDRIQCVEQCGQGQQYGMECCDISINIWFIMDINQINGDIISKGGCNYFDTQKKALPKQCSSRLFDIFCCKNSNFGGLFFILDMNPKLLFVYTAHPHQKVLLQQEYSLKNQYFVVPAAETETLQTVIRSICFEYSRNTPSSLVEKLKQLVFSCMKMTFSLTLFRQIVQTLTKTEQTLKQFKHYFHQINNVISDDEEAGSSLPTQTQQGAEEEIDYLFQVAERGEMRVTQQLDQQQQINLAKTTSFNQTQRKLQTVRTQQTITRVFNPEERELNQKLEIQNQFPNFFYSAQTNYDRNWWKAVKGHDDESKEISNFDKKGANPLNQKSITNLIIQEMKHDLNREIQLGKEVRKHENNQTYKFNKMMKGKLLTAKMKKKGRRT